MPIADPFAEAARHAANVRDFYEAYIREGFTEEQAMKLLVAILECLIH